MQCLENAWSQHAPELRSWMRRRLQQPQDVDDLMQDLFIKAMRQRHLFCNVAHPRAWLFEVARNMLADKFKRKLDWVELPPDLVAEVANTDAVDQLTTCLPRVLAELSPTDRDAITWCDLQGMSQADYAAQAGLGLSAAKSRLQRARVRMHDHMKQACQVTLDTHGHVEDFLPRDKPLAAP